VECSHCDCFVKKARRINMTTLSPNSELTESSTFLLFFPLRGMNIK
jgi:hypothetical protein